MDKAIAYFSPEAIGSPYQFFTDGRLYYQRAHGLGNLGKLDGWLRRIGKKIKKVAKKAIKSVGKNLKTVVKVVKKIQKIGFKLIKKALPIINTALTFVPGAGWMVKAALTAAEMGVKAIDKAKKRKKLRQQAAELNRKTTIPAKPAQPLNPVERVASSQALVPAFKTVPVNRAPVYTAKDFIKINSAVTDHGLTPGAVTNLIRTQANQSLQTILRF
jgi:hypothetical protein